ncbi:exported hypothetical protein [uncultured Mycobacterium sp.]|uniref:Uncharacterized protein n=1 Tax=uncultured Mycobacterium sp. TaxID=171292 RepID=A0A1Y5P7G6_9MYCO|nr:exported hypothetical protein [uncultured Mycobacterium sp.]
MRVIECTESSAHARTKPPLLSNKIAGGLVFAGLGASALAATLGTAPQASASCASFFGVGNSSDCVSSPTSIAIALGPGARAYALGTLGSAISVGSLSYSITEGGTAAASATALGNGAGAYVYNDGRLSTAFAAGTNAASIVNGGALELSGAFGDRTVGYTGPAASGKPAYGNLAIAMGNSPYFSQAVARGTGNIALNVISPSSAKAFGSNVVASGAYNFASSLFSRDSLVFAGYGGKQQIGSRNVAFSIFGRGNDVEAHGPGSIVGSLFQAAATVFREGPGLTINGPALRRQIAPGQRRTSAQVTTHGAKSGRRGASR